MHVAKLSPTTLGVVHLCHAADHATGLNHIARPELPGATRSVDVRQKLTYVGACHPCGAKKVTKRLPSRESAISRVPRWPVS